MTDDSSREASYEALRGRFINDPEFRSQVTSDPAGTLESVLGPLTEDERSRLERLTASPVSTDELLERVRKDPPPVGIW
jgi:hypothetical protein